VQVGTYSVAVEASGFRVEAEQVFGKLVTGIRSAVGTLRYTNMSQWSQRRCDSPAAR
jgi:hypothetical protein